MTIRTPPPTASIATAPDESGKLYAPSAARNAADLCDVVASIAPVTGNALEIASGTGQHITAFAATVPDIRWHPSEVDPVRLRSIDVYVQDSGLDNICAPVTLNAARAGWSDEVAPKDLIVLVNLLHLISEAEAETLVLETARTLTPKGQLLLYGPFKRDGVLTSDGDARFDAGIRAADPQTGYKDDAWVKAAAQQAGLVLAEAREMPANNLALIFAKP